MITRREYYTMTPTVQNVRRVVVVSAVDFAVLIATVVVTLVLRLYYVNDGLQNVVGPDMIPGFSIWCASQKFGYGTCHTNTPRERPKLMF